MKLSAGCRYKRRNGTITPPLVTAVINLVDPETGFYYDRKHDGWQVTATPHPYDLMEEYNETEK